MESYESNYMVWCEYNSETLDPLCLRAASEEDAYEYGKRYYAEMGYPINDCIIDVTD